jgi:hypothetical protein
LPHTPILFWPDLQSVDADFAEFVTLSGQSRDRIISDELMISESSIRATANLSSALFVGNQEGAIMLGKSLRH